MPQYKFSKTHPISISKIDEESSSNREGEDEGEDEDTFTRRDSSQIQLSAGICGVMTQRWAKLQTPRDSQP